MSDIGEPVDMSTTMIKRMNELMGDHSVHMGLITDIILAQNNLEDIKTREVQLFLKFAFISQIPRDHKLTCLECLYSLFSINPIYPLVKSQS
jgi:hypothetical protein